MTSRAPLAQPLTLDFNLVEVRHPERGRELLGVSPECDVAALGVRLTALEATVAALPAPTTTGHVPVGSVVAYLKDLSGTPALPTEFAECNGQTLNDPASPFHGRILPNLNGASSGTKRFLRGATSSGGTGGSETHTHGLSTSSASMYSGSASYVRSSPTQSTSTLPSYYEVVWVLRIK